MKDLNAYFGWDLLAVTAMKTQGLSDKEITAVKEVYLATTRDTIYEFAKSKKILPFIANLFCRLKMDEGYWSKVYNYYEDRNLKIITLLNNVFIKLLAEKANKIFVYENFGALLASDISIGCFASEDVDLYADISIKSNITKVMISEGFIPKPASISINGVRTEYFNKTLFEKGFGFNIMWKPLSRIKLPFPLNIDNCVVWDKLNTYKSTSIQLSGNDALMYLCLLHISVHGFNRSPDIRLYTDTARVALTKPDWNRIADFARYDKTEVRTATAAILSHKLLGMPLPEVWNESYPKRYWQVKQLLKRVYDSENNCLKKEPGRIAILQIEILSSDSALYKSILNILFPPKNWIREYYLKDNGFILKGYLMHLKNLV